MRARRSRVEARTERRRNQNRDHAALLQLVDTETSTKRKHQKRKSYDSILPKTKNQAKYDQAISANIITFGVGLAGTGKTWWAAMRAAKAFESGQFEKLIITRPAIEAGESLGFLPGEMDEKFDPYFRPVYDALAEFLGSGPLEYALKAGQIEARPLAYLRGATFKNSFVLLDEAQNTTPAQMKMFLSRIGEDSKIVINGDPDQADITGPSGLVDAMRRLDGLDGVSIIDFTEDDIVRSGICKEIVKRYANRIAA